MSETSTTTTQLDLLEQLADRIAARSPERDHGIAWAADTRTHLHSLLHDVPESDENPLEADTTLISIYWNPSLAGDCTRRLYTVELPSGRELLVDDFDVAAREVIGVIDREDEHAHLRAFQAAISGEKTSEPLLTGFPDSTQLAFGGVVLVDAFGEALRRSSYAAEFIGESEFYWITSVGEDAKQRLIAALEEELEEPAADDRANELEEMLDTAESTPSWLWSIEDEDAERIAAFAEEGAPIELYSEPGIPESSDPLVGAEDPLYQAAALLVAFGDI
jgi:hypothetical protein